jgi:hypothetical protein
MQKTNQDLPKPSSSRLRCAIYTRKSTEEGLEQEFNLAETLRVRLEDIKARHDDARHQPARTFAPRCAITRCGRIVNQTCTGRRRL